MQFTNEQFDAFRKDFKEALKDVGAKYGVAINPKHITYNSMDGSFVMKVEVTNVSEEQVGLDADQVEFEKHCAAFGLKKSDYKRVFTISGHNYELIGLKPSAHKNPCRIRDTRSGATYVCAVSYLIPPTNKHRCKYCGNWVDGTNEDELCDECKETFGHSLYSEL